MNTCPLQSEAMAWGSHLPALFAAIGASSGPVLELGIGHFSTPVLHALCDALCRELWSVEADSKWFEPFAKRYENPRHHFRNSKYPEILPMLRKHMWGAVLIDNSPGGANRAFAFEAFREVSQFVVVVHDYHLENFEAISPLLAGMNFHVTTTYQPPTLIASRSQKIPESILCL